VCVVERESERMFSPIRLAIEEAEPLWSTPNRLRSTIQTSRPSHQWMFV